MRVTADTITREQILLLLANGIVDSDTAHVAFNGWPDELSEARARCADIWNAREEPEPVGDLSVACPTCDVAVGIRCTAMTHSGYKPLRESHDEAAL